MVSSISTTSAPVEDFEFVITAPENFAKIITYDNSVRQTHGVLIEMFISAKKYIVIAAPYLRDFQYSNFNLNRALIKAIERGVTISILSTKASIDDARINQYEQQRINLFIPISHADDAKVIGSHAKFCIVDGESVYLGSANFTFHGLNRHFEMGVYSRGALVKRVELFWKYLIEEKYFIPYSQ